MTTSKPTDTELAPGVFSSQQVSYLEECPSGATFIGLKHSAMVIGIDTEPIPVATTLGGTTLRVCLYRHRDDQAEAPLVMVREETVLILQVYTP